MTFSRLRHRLGDEAGMSYVFIGLGMMAFLSASMLAIDVGMLMTARNQAQNSADAGALAGATALVLRQLHRSFAERTGGHQRHRRFEVERRDGGGRGVDPCDVEFLNDATGSRRA